MDRLDTADAQTPGNLAMLGLTQFWWGRRTDRVCDENLMVQVSMPVLYQLYQFLTFLGSPTGVALHMTYPGLSQTLCSACSHRCRSTCAYCICGIHGLPDKPRSWYICRRTTARYVAAYYVDFVSGGSSLCGVIRASDFDYGHNSGNLGFTHCDFIFSSKPDPTY